MSRTARLKTSMNAWRSPGDRSALGFINTRCHTIIESSLTLPSWFRLCGDPRRSTPRFITPRPAGSRRPALRPARPWTRRGTAALGFPIARRLRSGVLRLRTLLESIAGIAVFAARPPVAAAFFGRRFRRALRGLRRLGRLPQSSAREPLHDDVGVLPAKLMESGEKLFALAGAKGRRLLVDENRPVRVARGHPCYCCRLAPRSAAVRPDTESPVPGGCPHRTR